MNRYDLITGKKIKESLDQKINQRALIQTHIQSGPRCEICGDEIPQGWLNGEQDFLICSKKFCWEKFLPPDLVDKFLKSKSRYDLLKEQNT